MIGLTRKQAELLAFLTKYLAENDGVAPSFDEMKAGVGPASKSGVHRLMESLENKGRVRRVHFSARAIEVVGSPVERTPLQIADMICHKLRGRHQANGRLTMETIRDVVLQELRA